MSRHVAVNDTARRVVRTLVQVGIPSFLTFALALPQIIDALGLPVDSGVYLWLLGAAATVTAVATALSRIMAIPAVNGWLASLGLSTDIAPSVKVTESDAETVAAPVIEE